MRETNEALIHAPKEDDDELTFIIGFFCFVLFCAFIEDDDEPAKLVVFFFSFDGL